MFGKKQKLITALMIISIFASLLIYKLCQYCTNLWDNIGFEIIIRQMKMSISGADRGLVRLFVEQYFYGILVFILILVFLVLVIHNLSDDSCLRVKVFLSGSTFDVKISSYAMSIMLDMLIFIITIFSIIIAYLSLDNIGAISYVKYITHTTSIFEEHYYDTKKVSVTFPTEKKNLIWIYMESMETTYASKEEGGAMDESYIPNLVNMANENVSFSPNEGLGGCEVFDSAYNTVGALFASSTGIPFNSGVGNAGDLLGSIMPGATAIGEILEENGYDNYFQCGSWGEFGSRDLFYKQHGNYTVYDLHAADDAGDIPKGYYNGFWGYEDSYLYEIAKNKLEEIGSKDRPFNYTMLTVDTHFPDGYTCSLCGNEWDNEYSNVITCADRQVSDFLEWCKHQKWYENTVIVITGDHLTMKRGYCDDIGKYNRLAYNCFINVDEDIIDAGNVKGRRFTAVDYFPTVLACLNVKMSSDRLGLGTNLLSDTPTLLEEMGHDDYMDEISGHSLYYDEHIEKAQ